MPEAITDTPHPLVGAGVSLDAPDVVHQLRVLEDGLRNEFGAQRVPRASGPSWQNRPLGSIMRGRHGTASLHHPRRMQRLF